MIRNLSADDKTVIKTIGAWSDDTIYGKGLVNFFQFEAARVSVLIVGSQYGHTQKYIYYYRWVKTLNGSYPTAEFWDDHQPSLRACVSKVNAWEKQFAL